MTLSTLGVFFLVSRGSIQEI